MPLAEGRIPSRAAVISGRALVGLVLTMLYGVVNNMRTSRLPLPPGTSNIVFLDQTQTIQLDFRSGRPMPAWQAIGQFEYEDVEEAYVPVIAHPFFTRHRRQLTFMPFRGSERSTLSQDEEQQLRTLIAGRLQQYGLTQFAQNALRGDASYLSLRWAGLLESVVVFFVVFAGYMLFGICIELINRSNRADRRVMKFIERRCPNCNYDIRLLPETRCPECGETWKAEEVKAAVNLPKR